MRTIMSDEGLFSIAGKTALVTGGSRGVGLMIARAFVEAGANVYISARSADVCDKVAAELSQLPGGGKCVSLPADLSTEEGCGELVRAVGEREDSLDILVNNAGANEARSMKHLDEEMWQQLMALNVEAPFFLTRELLPLLKAASREGNPARVLNIGSTSGATSGITGVGGFAYSTSKAAVHHLTAHMARKLAPEVTVNALALGPFESSMTELALKIFRKAVLGLIPLQRIGRSDDLAGTAILFVSPAGSYLTGVVMPLDGGYSTI